MDYDAKLAELRDELQVIEDAAQAINDEIERVKIEKGEERIKLMSSGDFVTDSPTSPWSERPYILPFGRGSKKWSPYDVENAEFGKDWLENTTVLMCLRTDQDRSYPTRLIFTSSLDLSERDKIGNEFIARHDQTGAKLGVYKIVGLVFYGKGGDIIRTVGDVPDRKISQNTYK